METGAIRRAAQSERPTTAGLRGRDLVSSADLTRDEYEIVFERAVALKREFRAGRRHAQKLLADRSIALIFEKQSLRTRVTFEAGIDQLGGSPLYLAEGIGLGVRESVSDIAHNLERWVDAVVAPVSYTHLRA